MGGTFTVISQSTFEEMQLDAGVLLNTFNPSTPVEPQDADIICATTGGITANCTPTFVDMGEDIDNCPNDTMELKRITAYACTLGFTSLGVSPEQIKLALGAADVTGNKITPRMELKDTDFTDLWWVGDRSDGGMVAIKLKNALSTGGFALTTTKAGKGQVAVTLTGHVSIADQGEVPMEFYSASGQ